MLLSSPEIPDTNQIPHAAIAATPSRGLITIAAILAISAPTAGIFPERHHEHRPA